MMDEGHNNTGRPKKLTFRMLVKPENTEKLSAALGGTNFPMDMTFRSA